MLNTITVAGRICNDLELKVTNTGTEVVSFTVACERDFKDKNGEKQTDFIDCIAFKNTAQFVSRYFSKGRMAIVNGQLQTRSWEDKNGNKRKSVEIIANNVYFGDSKQSDNGAVPQVAQQQGFVELDNGDDLPF